MKKGDFIMLDKLYIARTVLKDEIIIMNMIDERKKETQKCKNEVNELEMILGDLKKIGREIQEDKDSFSVEECLELFIGRQVLRKVGIDHEQCE